MLQSPKRNLVASQNLLKAGHEIEILFVGTEQSFIVGHMVVRAEPQEVIWMVIVAPCNRVQVRGFASVTMAVADGACTVSFLFYLPPNSRGNMRAPSVFARPRFLQPVVKFKNLILREK